MHPTPASLNRVALLLQFLSFWLVTTDLVGKGNLERAAGAADGLLSRVRTGLEWIARRSWSLGKPFAGLLILSFLSLGTAWYLQSHPLVPPMRRFGTVPQSPGSLLNPITPVRPRSLTDPLPTIDPFQQYDPIQQYFDQKQREEADRSRKQTTTRIIVLSIPFAVAIVAYSLVALIALVLHFLADYPRVPRRLLILGAFLFHVALVLQYAATYSTDQTH